MTEQNKSDSTATGCFALLTAATVIVLFILMTAYATARVERIEKVLHLQKPCAVDSWIPPHVVCPE